MNDLDLSDLTDDQLIELTRLVAREIGRRDAAVYAAAQEATIDEAEAARVRRQAAEAEAARLRTAQRRAAAAEGAEAARRRAGSVADVVAARQRALWAARATLGLMIRETLGADWSVSVWSRAGDRRVYLDWGAGRHGDDPKVTYFVTGNSKHPPGRLVAFRLPREVDRNRLRAICAYAAQRWEPGERFACDAAVGAGVPPEPFPDDYLAACGGTVGATP